MTIKEMVYVLDKEKDCIIKRSSNLCEKNCTGCECHIEVSNLLDAFERIINLIFKIDKDSTRKEY